MLNERIALKLNTEALFLKFYISMTDKRMNPNVFMHNHATIL